MVLAVNVIVYFSIPYCVEAFWGRSARSTPPPVSENEPFVEEEHEEYENKGINTIRDHSDNHLSLIESLQVSSETDNNEEAASDLLDQLGFIHPVDGTVLESIQEVSHEDLPNDPILHHTVLKSMCEDNGYDSDDCHVAASGLLKNSESKLSAQAELTATHKLRTIIHCIIAGVVIVMAGLAVFVRLSGRGAKLRHLYSTLSARNKLDSERILKDFQARLDEMAKLDKYSLDDPLTAKEVVTELVRDLGYNRPIVDTSAARRASTETIVFVPALPTFS